MERFPSNIEKRIIYLIEMNSMEFKKVFTAGIIGTSAMTIFSYLVSVLMNENFREPEIMTILIKNILPVASQYAPYLAWSLHYFIGFIFVFIYVRLLDHNKLKANIESGLLLGAISGIVGITGWYFTLKIHPELPVINPKHFFILLFFAHIILGIFAVIGYILVKKLTGNVEKTEYKKFHRNQLSLFE